jgi:hypothetical protein
MEAKDGGGAPLHSPSLTLSWERGVYSIILDQRLNLMTSFHNYAKLVTAIDDVLDHVKTKANISGEKK